MHRSKFASWLSHGAVACDVTIKLRAHFGGASCLWHATDLPLTQMRCLKGLKHLLETKIDQGTEGRLGKNEGHECS